jgi:hypothetical protein
MPRNHDKPDGYNEDPAIVADWIEASIIGANYDEWAPDVTPYNGEMRIAVKALRMMAEAEKTKAAEVPKPAEAAPSAPPSPAPEPSSPSDDQASTKSV